jgi:hypothetical protein
MEAGQEGLRADCGGDVAEICASGTCAKPSFDAVLILDFRLHIVDANEVIDIDHCVCCPDRHRPIRSGICSHGCQLHK